VRASSSPVAAAVARGGASRGVPRPDASPTVRTALAGHDNDFSELERRYALATGEPLVGDVLRPDAAPARGALSVSVVVPARNAGGTLPRCLGALAASSFARRRSGLLEVVVVDDGSDVPVRVGRRLPMPVEVVRTTHGGRARAMNVGLAAAGGDVVVSCDSDMLLAVHSLSALTVRHEVLGGAVLVGFRSDATWGDADLDAAMLGRAAVRGDVRLAFDWPGWPESMAAATAEFRTLGGGRRLWMPSGDTWTLPRMVFGCLFSALRDDLLDAGGYDESFAGWGWEDTQLAARLIAGGRRVVPVYTASGFHVPHALRSRRQWREGRRNRARYQRLLAAAAPSLPPRARPDDVVPPAAALPAASGSHADGHDLAAVGRYAEAAELLGLAAASDPAAALGRGRALRLGGTPELAVAVLSPLVETGGAHWAGAAAELCLALAALGRFDRAHEVATAALRRDRAHRTLRSILLTPAYKHARRAERYAAQGDAHVAVRGFEVMLIQRPDDAATRARREEQSALAAGRDGTR
jgi:glycosyltransferase involved in cell wall biosynthesis